VSAVPPVRVLLVDDDEEDAMSTRELLAGSRKTRFETTWARDAASALQHLREGSPFDVCLLDLRLGPDSGLEVLGLLVAEARRAGYSLPIVVLTGAPDEEADLRAMDAGATEYLVKRSLDATLLERTIRYALANHRQRMDLAAANERLAAVVRRQNEILGMAAHDLRSPLGVVLSYVTFLRDRLEQLPVAEQRELIERAQTSVRFMVTLIDDLLDYSEIESGTLSLSPEDVEIAALTEALLEDERRLAEPKAIRIVLDAEDRSIRARVDPRRYQQLLQNLVANAVKFSHPGGEIRVTLRPGERTVRITVADRGTGMSPEIRERLFDPFARGRAKGTSGEKSTGLGLAIVRRIVDAHGGRIEVESELGAGTRFHLEIDRVS
jgi:signal transduction histidine kinase